jgi:hypothetical protein
MRSEEQRGQGAWEEVIFLGQKTGTAPHLRIIVQVSISVMLSEPHVIFHRKAGIFENSHSQTAADIAACMDRYGNQYVPILMKQSEVAPRLTLLLKAL